MAFGVIIEGKPNDPRGTPWRIESVSWWDGWHLIHDPRFTRSMGPGGFDYTAALSRDEALELQTRFATGAAEWMRKDIEELTSLLNAEGVDAVDEVLVRVYDWG